MIPNQCKYDKPPIISYKYIKNIGQSILNYKSTLLNISESDIFSNCQCDCQSNQNYSPFVDHHHKHIFTGDLNIIDNSELRNLMKKGTKFRECPSLDINKLVKILSQSIDSFCVKWAKLEHKSVNEFSKWLTSIKQIIKDKLFAFKSKHAWPMNILNSTPVSKYLKELQDRFVITPIDKAGNNFGIICKWYYISVLKKELGIDNILGIHGNTTYQPINSNITEIIEKHKHDLNDNYNIKISDKDSFIPLLFWVPKLHKNPYKSRFIAGASNCSTKQLSIEVTLCLTKIREHFQKYCATIYNHTGINCFWSIKNSMEFVSKINKLHAKSIDTFDFSTLYTNLPLQN